MDRQYGDDSPRLSAQELYTKCEQKARVAEREVYDQALSLIAGELTFPKHLFDPDPLDEPLSPDDSEDLKVSKTIHLGIRYQEVLKLLQAYPNRGQRWVILAMWLKQEGICEPRQFLPDKVYEELIAENRQSLGVSIRDQQHYHQVEAWRPYFERMMAERKGVKGDPKRHLLTLGYTEKAIQSANGKRLAVPAICAFLASSEVDAPAIRNAHSRVSRTLHKSR